MATDPLLPVGDGHTALSEDDRRGLIPTHIATRGDLYEAEESNIATALLGRRAPSVVQLLDDHYLRGMHRAMFGDTWRWAGTYRTSETNIGIPSHRIAEAVRSLVQDARAWVAFGTYPPDEIAVRFHHRLVQIHPFPNGNGRHSRVAADYLVQALGGRPFSWGAGLDAGTDDLRARYRHALVRADAGEIEELVDFARR